MPRDEWPDPVFLAAQKGFRLVGQVGDFWFGQAEGK
jgi:hypothetical protein